LPGRKNCLRKIVPLRIRLLNEPEFLFAAPRLDFFFAADCIMDVGEGFKMHQTENVVPRGESRHAALAVLSEPSLQMICHARVQVARAARQDVYAIRSAHIAGAEAALYAGLIGEIGEKEKGEKEERRKKQIPHKVRERRERVRDDNFAVVAAEAVGRQRCDGGY
jgi:hypothetical protein